VPKEVLVVGSGAIEKNADIDITRNRRLFWKTGLYGKLKIYAIW